MSRDTSRLVMELDKVRREINREMIKPGMGEVDVSTLTPVVTLCAKARAAYIQSLMDLAAKGGAEMCSHEEVEQLRQHRIAYEELVAAANALETVIKRGYVDVIES